MKLSVYIVTLNEEQRLNRTLIQAAKVADEIIIVDSGSTDNTVNIAHKHGAKVIFHEWESYCKQKHFAEQQCKNDWVLLLDADEVLSDALVAEINNLGNKPKYNAYRIKITNMLPHEETPRKFAETFNVVRLYNRKYASMPEDLWNKDRVSVDKGQKIGNLKAPILHYCLLSIEQATNKYNIHSTELQKTLIAEKRHFSILRLVTEFPRQFCRYYFCKKFIFMGVNGFIQAMLLANFRFLKIAKYFEARSQNRKN